MLANHPSSAFTTTPLRLGSPEYVVRNSGDSRENGVFAARAFDRSSLVAKIFGSIVHERSLHTLQIGDGIHLYDPEFTGLFLHSCAPNVRVDMQRFEVHAVLDIESGEPLCMDYSSTEDVLHRQFPCLCGSRACRGWITGYREPINQEGVRYLQSRMAKAPLRGVV
ncbi:MAG: SET domain-containing protein-lysine N-methyltransferase [Planctomycetota bacterium]